MKITVPRSGHRAGPYPWSRSMRHLGGVANKPSKPVVKLGCAALLVAPPPALAADAGDAAKPPTLEKANLDGLAFRSIGPAVTGGRVIDIEVNPRDHSEYYVASAHGSLWKTTNAGVTFSPVFDGQTSFAIGAVTLDPS